MGQINCDYCSEPITTSYFKCKYCSKIFCSKHKVAEFHDCSIIERHRKGEVNVISPDGTPVYVEHEEYEEYIKSLKDKKDKTIKFTSPWREYYPESEHKAYLESEFKRKGTRHKDTAFRLLFWVIIAYLFVLIMIRIFLNS